MKEPGWLIHLIDQRMALIEQALGSTVPDTNVIMTPLTEATQDSKIALEFWERSCDNCGTYCKDETPFFTGHVMRELRCGTRVFMTFGVCQGCKPSLEE